MIPGSPCIALDRAHRGDNQRGDNQRGDNQRGVAREVIVTDND